MRQWKSASKYSLDRETGGATKRNSPTTMIVTIAGVGFPLGMYWGQSWGRGSDLSHRRFLAEVNHSHEGPPPSPLLSPRCGFKPSLAHVFWRGRGGSLLWREERVMDITRVQAPNLVLSHRVDASSPGFCVTWQDAANFMTTFWSIWHVTVPSHTNAKRDNVGDVASLAVPWPTACLTHHLTSS